MKEIKGFFVLPLTLGASTHYIYFKKHEANGSDSKSIFIFNLPIGTDFTTIKKFYQEIAIGSIVESYQESKLTNHTEDTWVNLSKLTSDLIKDDDVVLPKNCGIVSFIDKSSFNLAFNSMKKVTKTTWPIKKFSSAYFLQSYQNEILDKDKLLEEVAQDLENFNKLEKESIEELQKPLVDEDGFTLVVGKHSKTKAGILGKQKNTTKIETDKNEKKMKRKEKQDFYRFQLRQQKKDEMNELLLKFKQDQEKIKVMKEKKRFKPY